MLNAGIKGCQKMSKDLNIEHRTSKLERRGGGGWGPKKSKISRNFPKFPERERIVEPRKELAEFSFPAGDFEP